MKLYIVSFTPIGFTSPVVDYFYDKDVAESYYDGLEVKEKSFKCLVPSMVQKGLLVLEQ